MISPSCVAIKGSVSRCLCTALQPHTVTPLWWYGWPCVWPLPRQLCGPIGFARPTNALLSATGNQSGDTNTFQRRAAPSKPRLSFSGDNVFGAQRPIASGQASFRVPQRRLRDVHRRGELCARFNDESRSEGDNRRGGRRREQRIRCYPLRRRKQGTRPR